MRQSYFQLWITDDHVAERSFSSGRPPGFVQPITPEIVKDELSVRAAAARALVTTATALASTSRTVSNDLLVAAATTKSVNAVLTTQAELSRMVVLLREDEEFLLGVI